MGACVVVVVVAAEVVLYSDGIIYMPGGITVLRWVNGARKKRFVSSGFRLVSQPQPSWLGEKTGKCCSS